MTDCADDLERAVGIVEPIAGMIDDGVEWFQQKTYAVRLCQRDQSRERVQTVAEFLLLSDCRI